MFNLNFQLDKWLERFKRNRMVFNKDAVVEYDQALQQEKQPSGSVPPAPPLSTGNDRLAAIPAANDLPVGLAAETESASEFGTESRIMETNLISSEIVPFFDWHSAAITVLTFTLLGMIIVGSGFFGLVVWERYQKDKAEIANNNIALKKTAIIKLQRDLDAITSTQRKFKLSEKIINGHVYWTNLFALLEQNTLGAVYYDAFEGGLTGDYKLTGHAPDFQSIAQQVDAFRANKFVKSALVKGGEQTTRALSSDSAGEPDDEAAKLTGEVTFELELGIQPALFSAYRPVEIFPEE